MGEKEALEHKSREETDVQRINNQKTQSTQNAKLNRFRGFPSISL